MTESTSPAESSSPGAAPSGVPAPRRNGRRLVVGILIYAGIFGLALSLTIRHVVHEIRDSARDQQSEEAATKSDGAPNEKTGNGEG